LALVQELWAAGFKAVVVCVDGRYLSASYAGRLFDADFVASLPQGVDACGENGEFHTFVYDGPNFKTPVPWQAAGKRSYTSPPEFGSVSYHFGLIEPGAP
jgi:diphthamide synthase (EF-2-diphthine--ammonia ligase)